MWLGMFNGFNYNKKNKMYKETSFFNDLANTSTSLGSIFYQKPSLMLMVGANCLIEN